MSRFDNIAPDTIKDSVQQGLYFPCRIDRNICLFKNSGVFKTGAQKNIDTLVAKFVVLANSGEDALLPIAEIPASVVDGAIKPGVPGVPGVPGSACPGTEYTYLRKEPAEYPGTVNAEAKAITRAVEGVDASGVTSEMLNEYFDDCLTGSPLEHLDKGLLVVVTTIPKLSKNNKQYTAHSFSSLNDADLQVAAAAMSSLGMG